MNNNQSRRDFCATAIATILASAPYVWAAEKKYDSGASDTEIKLGQTVPHSGPGSLYGVLGRVGEAYFQMLNEKDGINGRKRKCWRCSVRSAPRRRPRCINISIPRACRSFCSTPAHPSGTIRRTTNGP